MDGTTVVIANPATPSASYSGATCEGGSVTLSTPLVLNATYSWTGPNSFSSSDQEPLLQNVSPADAGTYSVTITLNGCTSDPGTVDVVVYANPAAPTISGGPTTFCSGGSVTLTSSAASSYRWFLNGNPIGGATSDSYSANASGDYTVEITDANGCTATSAITTVTVNPNPPTPTISAGSATTFCDGGSVTLTSSSTTGNQWYNNGVPIPGAIPPDVRRRLHQERLL
jgi:hypothetical protein